MSARESVLELIKVLVVDDEPAVRNGLAVWLGRRGFSVLTASNLGSASRVASRDKPEVILLDVKLGAEDGLQLIGLLHSLGLEIPCVVLTGHAGPYDGFKAHKLGAVTLIEKPSSPDEIAGALRSAVAGVSAKEVHQPSPTAGFRRIGQPLLQVPLPLEPLTHRMRQAIDYIEANFTNSRLSAEDVADHIGVTPEHLSRMFQGALGERPSIIINRLRISRAQQILSDPRLSLGEIACICGYRSTRQLNGWFKLFFGQPPGLRRLELHPIPFTKDQEADQNIN